MQIFAKVANAQAQVATLIEVTDSSPVDNANSFEEVALSLLTFVKSLASKSRS